MNVDVACLEQGDHFFSGYITEHLYRKSIGKFFQTRKILPVSDDKENYL